MGRLHWVAQWLRLYAPNAGGLGSIPSQGTRSYMPQVRIPHATTKMEISVFHKKTQHSQINKDRKKNKKNQTQVNFKKHVGIHQLFTGELGLVVFVLSRSVTCDSL